MSDRHLQAVPDLPMPQEWWLEVRVNPDQFDRARDALMYWEVGNDRRRAVIQTADIAPDDVRMALSDDATGPLDCWGTVDLNLGQSTGSSSSPPKPKTDS